MVIDKSKVNKYLMDVFNENPINENSSIWFIITSFLEQEEFKANTDYDLAFSCKYIMFEGTKTNSNNGNTKQASISDGHLSISGIDSNMMISGGADNIKKADEIYKTLLKNADSSIFLQFNNNNIGCGC